MSQEQAAHAAAEASSVWLRPWRVLLMGLGAVLLGALLMSFDGPAGTPLRLLLMFAGLLVGGWAVKQHLTTAGEDFDERVESAGLVAVYSLCGIVGYLGMAEDWFSGRIFFAFFISATIVGSLLVLMPRVARRLVATLLILLHFGGIVVAITNIAPPNGPAPWLSLMLWSKVYRPYLSGLYLINAYHFYAPDPGNSTLVWIRIEYEDGSYRWLKFPNRQTSETPLHYQRQMGMCEATSNRSPVFPPVPIFEDLRYNRVVAGSRHKVEDIPLRSDISPYNQYWPPNEYSQIIMESMARHVCHFYPHPENSSVPAKRVKIYRLSYTIISPAQLLKDRDPLADDLKMPFYMGEYDRDGNLLRYDDEGKALPPEEAAKGHTDPFLYWVVPMDKLYVHAGDIKAVKPGEEMERKGEGEKGRRGDAEKPGEEKQP
jgi:hypothetical protein